MQQCFTDEIAGQKQIVHAKRMVNLTGNTRHKEIFNEVLWLLTETDHGKRLTSYINGIIKQHAANYGMHGAVDLTMPTTEAHEAEMAVIGYLKDLEAALAHGTNTVELLTTARTATQTFIRTHDGQQSAAGKPWTPHNGSNAQQLCSIYFSNGTTRTGTIVQAAYSTAVHKCVVKVRIL